MEYTAPYTPQEDGISENTNRVCITRANAMMEHANTPKAYWAAAVRTAIQLSNIVPTKGLKTQHKTPYELWFDRKPEVAHLRIWGSTAYSHTVKIRREDPKFGPRAQAYIFVGYTDSSKIWVLNDPIEKVRITSCDVSLMKTCYTTSSTKIDLK